MPSFPSYLLPLSNRIHPSIHPSIHSFNLPFSHSLTHSSWHIMYFNFTIVNYLTLFPFSSIKVRSPISSILFLHPLPQCSIIIWLPSLLSVTSPPHAVQLDIISYDGGRFHWNNGLVGRSLDIDDERQSKDVNSKTYWFWAEKERGVMSNAVLSSLFCYLHTHTHTHIHSLRQDRLFFYESSLINFGKLQFTDLLNYKRNHIRRW